MGGHTILTFLWIFETKNDKFIVHEMAPDHPKEKKMRV